MNEVSKGRKSSAPSQNARSRRALRLRHHGCDDSESEEDEDRDREPTRILRGKLRGKIMLKLKSFMQIIRNCDFHMKST